MSMMPERKFDYSDGRTKQSFKDETDINKLLVRAQTTGTISHLAKHQAVYGDFESFDFADAQNKIARANSIFEELPSEVRREFHQDPTAFFAYVNDEANSGDLANLLPKLAEPGRQMISLNRPPAEPAAVEPTPPPTPPEPVVGEDGVGSGGDG